MQELQLCTTTTPFPLVDVERAIQALQAGHLVAFPTETVYGLAASLQCPKAIEQIFIAKGRPSSHPLIVHVGKDRTCWQHLVKDVHPVATALMEAFWPGPLTLVLPKTDAVPHAVTGGKPTVALRVPQHPVAQAVLASGLAVVAPSANRFGRISPTTLNHVEAEFQQVAFPAAHSLYLLDGGACEVGVESTLVDASQIEAVGVRVLRLGGVALHAIEDVAQRYGVACHDVSHTAKAVHEDTEASGTYARHYAPRTPAHLIHVGDLEEAIWQIQASHNQATIQQVGVFAFSECPALLREYTHWIHAPLDAPTYAQVLYATLRQLDDAEEVTSILIERPPHHPDWATVLDRLTRATTAE